MSTVWSQLYYSAPLTPMGREDNWLIDALSQPPEVLFNFRKVAIDTKIADLRDHKIQPKLDEMGFEKIVSPTRVDQHALSDGSEASLEQYQSETAPLLKALTDADAVVFFDANLRREDTDAPNDMSYQSAHLRVHVDQNPRSARIRAVNHGGPQRRFRRFQIVNIWRPLIEPVRNFPLALCDYRSVNVSADLVPTKLHFPAWLKDRENYSVKHSASHRWYYWTSLSPDETIVFKCYDSASRDLALFGESVPCCDDLIDVAGLCPHTAFFDISGPRAGRLRMSLELRALLFYN